MPTSVNQRVWKHRMALREAGLRPVQIWVPDTRKSGFSEECRRQGRVTAKADLADRNLLEVMDAALADADEWTT